MDSLHSGEDQEHRSRGSRCAPYALNEVGMGSEARLRATVSPGVGVQNPVISRALLLPVPGAEIPQTGPPYHSHPARQHPTAGHQEFLDLYCCAYSPWRPCIGLIATAPGHIRATRSTLPDQSQCLDCPPGVLGALPLRLHLHFEPGNVHRHACSLSQLLRSSTHDTAAA